MKKTPSCYSRLLTVKQTTTIRENIIVVILKLFLILFLLAAIIEYRSSIAEFENFRDPQFPHRVT